MIISRAISSFSLKPLLMILDNPNPTMFNKIINVAIILIFENSIRTLERKVPFS
jgi:hypothetical protein